MAITANAKVLIRRLEQFQAAARIENAPADATRQIAHSTIDEVAKNAQTRLSARDDQVGFDLSMFLSNIRGPQRFGPANYAILDTRKMGTLEDIEDIADVDGLWHMGTAAGASFRRLIYNIADKRSTLAEFRRMIWGRKTPQWIFLENGTFGVPGVNPAGPPDNFIRDAKTGILPKYKDLLSAALIKRGVKLL